MHKLSVVITSNREDRLGDIFSLLSSIAWQKTSYSIQPIFVVENSTFLYQRLNAVEIGLTLCQAPKGTGLAGCRNIGIKKATGDIIAFLDDDVLPNAYWAEEMMKAYHDGDPIGITGQAIPLWTNHNMDWLPKELDWLISCTRWTGWTGPREIVAAWGMNMSFKREAFEKCGLFNEDTGYHKGFVAEDIEFSHRARRMTGKSIWFCPQAKVYHRVYPYRLTFKYIKERATWIGFTHRMAKTLYPNDNLAENETKLLRNIFTRLLPSIPPRIFTEPTTAYKQLTTTLLALFWVAYGYYIKPRLEAK